jgi:hypothetical protein
MKKFLGNHHYFFSISLILLSYLVSSLVFAQKSDHGHGALAIFDNEGFSNNPLWVQIGIGIMMLSFACSFSFADLRSLAGLLVVSYWA